MDPEIRINGTVTLREDYKNEKDKLYYAVLSLSVKAEGQDRVSPTETKFEVPISAQQYEQLRKEISESRAEEPVLRLKGCLELILGSVCIN